MLLHSTIQRVHKYAHHHAGMPAMHSPIYSNFIIALTVHELEALLYGLSECNQAMA